MLRASVDAVAGPPWMTWQQLDFLETVGLGVFFPPSNFWQGPHTIILELYFLDTLGDALSN